MGTRSEPNLVKVYRLRKGHGDMNPKEMFKGYLVDENGNNIDSPEVGIPICLAGDDSPHPWLFRSDTIYRVDVYDSHWEIQTEEGTIYRITNGRVMQ